MDVKELQFALSQLRLTAISHGVFVTQRRYFPLKALAVLLIAYIALLGIGPYAGNQALAQSPQAASTQLEFRHVLDVTGLEGIKSGHSGNLVIGNEVMSFTAGRSQAQIPVKSIREFSIARDNVPLFRGAMGVITGMAPYGVGQLIGAIRPADDTLTLVYADNYHAIHGAVLLLHKGNGAEVVQVLARAGLSPRDNLRQGSGSIREGDEHYTDQNANTDPSLPSVMVIFPTENEDGIPSAFPVAVYENLVAQLQRSKSFSNVWRQGDSRISSGTIALRIDIQQLKKGSARSRAIIPFTGATVIKVETQLVDSEHRVLIEKRLGAAKRFAGENLDVARILSKRIEKEMLPMLSTQRTTSPGVR
jgi:hypothetical protein